MKLEIDLADIHVHLHIKPDPEVRARLDDILGQLGLVIENTESIMTVSPEVQAALDAVRQTQSLVQSVHAGIQVNNTLILDLQAQIAALQAGTVLSADDKAALVETAADLAAVNTQLASDIPAGTTQP
jgi:hypothetical protein